MTDIEDENRKLREENRALIHQRAELQDELRAHRWFVRLCGSVFAALDSIRSQHSALYAAEKSRPLATAPAVLVVSDDEKGGADDCGR